MPILRGFLYLLGFLLLGETVRFVFNWPISGGVTGMLLITVWLMVSGTVSTDLANASQQLISMLILLIMPGVVGVFFIGNQFSGQWLAIGVALMLGTFLSVLTTLLMLRYLAPTASRETSDE
ncbi:CidA/LrgA family protein [Marinobacter sp. X15-166B]|uniref:CidA/LrgA family protein n=1 Tax=Marinobacter sp. X15-166B TaxID=1897620 RepID=UPI00085CBD32|nr:CidA/LrgA family protein [Marinobacter sp. X15-166B]OEY65350.1 murein hydrolase transporter LrgA [Marinobacter sp. X15-166B]